MDRILSSFLRDIFLNDVLLLHLFGIFEIVLAFWILSGKNIFYPSVLAAIILLAIVLFNFGELDVLFRDISILATAVALVILHREIRT